MSSPRAEIAADERATLRRAVLIVDDEPSIPRVAAWFLARAGYRVATAVSTDSALALLATESFDLVITDLYMPGRNGIELGAEAIRRHPAIKLLLCTGLIDNLTWNRATAVGFTALVQKPFGWDDLISAVRSALEPDEAAA